MTSRIWNLDYNAGAGVDPRVAAAMAALPESADHNPHSPHRHGRAAGALLEEARERIAATLGVDPIEVVFTSGGTEANNLAVATGADAARRSGAAFYSSPLEHPSVREPVRALVERREVAVLMLEATPEGEVLWPADGPPPAFATVILAHHELGVLQDALDWSERLHAAGGLLHMDVSQALGRVDLAESLAAVDYATLSPHKAGGPRGIGLLIAKRGRPLVPFLRGGSQELGRRPGTQSPRLAYGAAIAIEHAWAERQERAESMQLVIRALLDGLPDGRFRVVCGGARALLPNTRTLCFHPLEARRLQPALDLAGLLVSFGAACTSGAREPSPSLFAVGLPEHEASCCLRISVGADLSLEKVREAVGQFGQVFARFEAMP